jgi:hypothetical protein
LGAEDGVSRGRSFGTREERPQKKKGTAEAVPLNSPLPSKSIIEILTKNPANSFINYVHAFTVVNLSMKLPAY